MKRKTAIFLSTFIFGITLLSACGNSNPNSSSFVGRWEFLDIVLEFYDNSTGIEIFEGQEFAFTWNINNDLLDINFVADTDGSIIYEILSLIIHGVPVGSFGFEMLNNDQTLLLFDDHGHRHFMLEFERAD